MQRSPGGPAHHPRTVGARILAVAMHEMRPDPSGYGQHLLFISGDVEQARGLISDESLLPQSMPKPTIFFFLFFVNIFFFFVLGAPPPPPPFPSLGKPKNVGAPHKGGGRESLARTPFWLFFVFYCQRYQRKTIRAFALFWQPDSSHIPAMANNPHHPKKPVKTPKSKAPRSKASRPDVQPIGPALAELLNPAINRGEAGVGSSTGLQPPPDNSWDRRAGGEAAAHRARASTRGTSDDVAKRDASSSPPPTREAAVQLHSLLRQEFGPPPPQALPPLLRGGQERIR